MIQRFLRFGAIGCLYPINTDNTAKIFNQIPQTNTLHDKAKPVRNIIIIITCAFFAWIAGGHALLAQGSSDLSGTIWIDANRNATFEPALTEAGISNVRIALSDENGAAITDPATGLPLTAQTDSDGRYIFAAIPDGEYHVQIMAENFANGAHLEQYASSNGEPLNGGIKSAAITLPFDPASGQSTDLGLYKPLQLSGQLWHDADGDGTIDGGAESGIESGIEGVVITLWANQTSANQTAVMTTTTADNGIYLFDDLLASDLVGGAYEIEIDASHFQIGKTLGGQSASTPSPADPNDLQNSGLRSDPFTLSENSEHAIDFGFYRAAQIGNLVWFDYDADGIQSALEPGVPNITVRLYQTDESGVLIAPEISFAETTTDAAGNYLFTNLLPGNYLVEFAIETVPAGYLVTQPHATNPLGDAVDSDADPISGRTIGSHFLESGSGTLNFDMGIHTLVSVGNKVWYDNDGDGVQDLLGEPGVPDVELHLYYANTNQPVLDQDNQNPLATTTNAAGEYVFENLRPNNYFVKVVAATLPSGFQISPHNINDSTEAGDAIDSDFDPATQHSTESGFLLGNGSAIDSQKMSLDLGLFSPLSIGDMVWFDRDGDGRYNPSGPNGVLGDDDDETGLPNVLVTLHDTNTFAPVMLDGVIRSTRTDSQGGYVFGNLDPGDYYLQFDLNSLPPGYQATLRNAASPDLDSDAHPTTGRTGATGPIALGQHQLDMDMGVWSPIGIAGRVWLDDDGDGRRDNAENSLFDSAQISSIQAHLHRTANDQIIASTTLDSGGYYTFTNAPPGDYYVQFDGLPIGYRATQQNGSDLHNSQNSDVDPATGRTPSTGNVPSNEWILNLDMGIYRTAIVSGLAWNDLNRDGIRGPAEAGASNIDVQLYRQRVSSPQTDEFIDITTTDSNGLYSFVNLAPGHYYTRFNLATLPANHVASRPNIGGEVYDGVDSDANPSSGRTALTKLIHSGVQQGGLDLGIHQLSGVRIGDTVWHDLNANGTQERHENGLSGVLLQLYATTDPNTILATTVTDADGVYLFDGLPATAYFVKIDPSSLPAATRAALPNIGTDDSIDSDFDPATQQSPSTGPMLANSHDGTLDAGFYQTASLGDRVWLDANANGIQDAGEEGVPGVNAILYNADNSPTGLAATTDADGHYLFENLTPGTYSIGYELPDTLSGYRFSPLNNSDISNTGISNTDESDSNVDPATQRTAPIVLYSGQQNQSVDAGLRHPLALSDLVWLDNNNNGQREENEAGLAGVTLTLYNAENELVATTISDGAGRYAFIDLTPGSYIVHVAAINFSAGQPLADLYSSDDSGNSTDSGIDSATPSASGIRSSVITLSLDELNQENSDVQNSAAFGFYAPLSIGNRVWHDANNDGEFNSAVEVGIDGVTLNLYRDENQDGQPDGEALTTLNTRDGGYYLFDNLRTGFYIVEVDAANFQAEQALAEYANSWQKIPDAETPATVNGVVDGLDNGIDSAQWRNDGIRSATIALQPNSAPVDEQDLGPQNSGIATNANSNLALDFGFFRAYQIESRIWFDDDNSGGTDGGESGLNGVLVELYADTNEDGLPDGTSLMTATTHIDLEQIDPDLMNGYFSFQGLPAGGYVVQVPASNFITDGPLADRLNSTEEPGGTDIPGLVIDDGIAVINPNEVGVRTPTIRLPRPRLSAASVPAVDDPGSDADFGFFESVEVGGKVWKDYNANGQSEPDRSEVGVPGVRAILHRVDGDVPVDLVGDSVAPQTTNDYGLYRFLNLPPGDYYVEFDLTTLPSATYAITMQDATGVDDGADSDVDPTTGLSTATGFLASSEINESISMGIYAPSNVGGVVWFDNSINGLHEPFDGEMGVPNVVATLNSVSTGTALLVAGQPVTQTTDANGYYVFEGVSPGNYFITFDLNTFPSAHRITLQNAFPEERSDSDADPLTGQTDETGVLSSGDVSMDLDMGIFPLVAVGDRVWFDDNHDGQQTLGELGVPDIRVTLYSTSTNAPVPNPANPATPWVQVTDDDGRYLFSGLETGAAYYVQFDLSSLPFGYVVTTPNVGGSATDSDADPLTGMSSPTDLLQDGNIDLTLDMGIIAPSGIGDRVWYDLDADGLYEVNDGEMGVAGVDVALYEIIDGNAENAQPVADPADPTRDWRVTTNESGLYLFTGLPSGEYFARFDLNTLPADHQPTWPHVGQDDQVNSDVDPATGQTPSTGPLFSGAQKLTMDMGIVGPVSVGSRVWFDVNRNGVQDDSETGVADVEVQIFAANGSPALDVSGSPVMATTTDADGLYRFDTLMPGSYAVAFNLDTLPAGYVVSKPNAGGNEAKDSDANPSRGWTRATAFLYSGDVDDALDMGIHEPFGTRVGDGVWHDLNANGIRERGEAGILGVTMELYVIDANGNSIGTGQTTVSDVDGNYLFDELPAGEYAIVFDLGTLPGGYQVSGNRPEDDPGSLSNVDIFSGETLSSGPLAEHEQYLGLDMGIYRPVSLGDFAWLDRDADGTYDVGEFSLSGVTVTLLHASGSPTGRSEVTDIAGRYLFENVVPGDYILEFLPPAGYSPTSVNQGPNSSVDSDVNPETRQSQIITVRSDRESTDWDAGFFTDAAIGNFVWLDENANGVQDAGESGLSGVTVRLYSPLGVPVRETYTDLNGFYGFSGLADSNFFLEFIAKDGLIFTRPNQDPNDPTATTGNNDGSPSDLLDSDAVVSNSSLVARTASRQLQTGVNYTDWDAGMTRPASIGNYVWFDFNRNGLKEKEEEGVNGVKVILYDERANIVASTFSDAGGFYQFDRLLPGKYRMAFEPPVSFQFTQRGAIDGSNTSTTHIDSDVDEASGETGFIELLPGQNDTTWGVGLIAAPGAITLSSIDVTLNKANDGTANNATGDDELIVQWITSAEIDTYGYHIRRGINGILEDAVQITQVIIPSQGTTGGTYEATFPYNAATDPPIGLLNFWLVEIEIEDKINVHGPVGVTAHSAGYRGSNGNGILFLPLVMK